MPPARAARASRPPLAMPRSFLVKKPSRTRVPNYGQLETHRQESGGLSHAWRAWPLSRQDGAASPSAPCKASPLGVPGSAAMCLLEPPHLLQDSQAQGEPTGERVLGGSRGSATPLRDNPNNLNLPSAFGLRPWRKCPSLGRLAETDGWEWMPETDRQERMPEPGRGPDPLERFRSPASHKAPHGQPCCRSQTAAMRKRFDCKYCEKAYASWGALKMHVRTHTLPCVCKICSKAFSRPWLLQGHIRTHTGEKPYTCPQCSRAFADRSNLRAHLQTHSGIKKHQCHACAKTFSRASLLLRHKAATCCGAAATVS